MFFILHYILFNAGMSAILILLTLYLQTYSDASLTEIGALLMVLPFVSIVVKPLFCALADRQQAHRQYLAGALVFMGLGYGSIAIAPFFPDFIKHHGRLVWYLDILGILIGFSAFGVVWSLGDALAVNMARVKGVPWGTYRVWATVSWGVCGYLIGQVNETPLLPKYTPAVFVLLCSTLLESVLVLIWSKRSFDMSAEEETPGQATGADVQQLDELAPPPGGKTGDADMVFDESHWPHASTMTGTLSGSTRTNPRLMGAVANIFMEDLAGSLKSSLRIGAPAKRVALNDLLKQHDLSSSSLPQRPIIPAAAPSPSMQRANQQAAAAAAAAAAVNSTTGSGQLPPQVQQVVAGSARFGTGGGTGGRAAWNRAQLMLSHMNSLSSASGNAIADQLREEFDTSNAGSASPANGGGRGPASQAVGSGAAMVMSSLASNASLSRAAAARAIGFGGANLSSSKGSSEGSPQQQQQVLSSSAISDVTLCGGGGSVAPAEVAQQAADTSKSVEDLQMVLLKLIVKRDRSVLKYLVLFTLFGILFSIHISYFFLYVEKLARVKNYDFSYMTGLFCMAESVSEIFSFTLVVPYWMPYAGRVGSFLTCGLMFATRYIYYGTYFAEFSPYYAIITELCHGIAYAITYTLITDIATECVDQVDAHMPELISRRIIDPSMHPNQLKLPLRATMQGVFSGAFDGLGNGLGCLFAGIYLDSYGFDSLSLLCAYLAIAVMILYPLSEWRSLCGSKPAPASTDDGASKRPKALHAH